MEKKDQPTSLVEDCARIAEMGQRMAIEQATFRQESDRYWSRIASVRNRRLRESARKELLEIGQQFEEQRAKNDALLVSLMELQQRFIAGLDECIGDLGGES